MELNRYIEHTLLKPDTTEEELIKLFKEAKDYSFHGVCINPCHVKFAKEYLRSTDVKIITVIGFPLGANKTETKVYETELALIDGADEIDMVMNIGALKEHNYNLVLHDIERVKNACRSQALKVIIETDLLTQDQIKKSCEICIQAKADFVKTSTGFVKDGVGAKVEDVKLMHEIVSPFKIGVKASGGIRDKETAIKMIKAGATRIGTSSGIEICKG